MFVQRKSYFEPYLGHHIKQIDNNHGFSNILHQFDVFWDIY